MQTIILLSVLQHYDSVGPEVCLEIPLASLFQFIPHYIIHAKFSKILSFAFFYFPYLFFHLVMHPLTRRYLLPLHK